MKLGIVGLPNVGKSTLFNALTNAGAESANYPFCTIDPNVGIVPVPDSRLDELAKMYNPEKYTPAVIEFVDIAGLVKGASKGEGLGNKFLANIREVDAIVHVVRCFVNDDIIHVDGSIDPVRDVETINLELVLADLETCQKRYEKAQKSARGNDKTAKAEAALLERILPHLEAEKPVRSLEMDEDEAALARSFFLLTTKPVIYAANISEDEIGSDLSDNAGYQKLAAFAKTKELAPGEEESLRLCFKLIDHQCDGFVGCISQEGYSRDRHHAINKEEGQHLSNRLPAVRQKDIPKKPKFSYT